METKSRVQPFAVFHLAAVLALVLSTSTDAQQYALHDLGTLGGTRSVATNVNASGQVVGFADNAFTHRGFLLTPVAGVWSQDLDLDGANDLMEDTGTLDPLDPPTNYAVCWGLNGLGQVVGNTRNDLGQTRAFLWESGMPMIDLGSLGRTTPHFATAVADDGTVVGSSYLTSTSFHAFYWTSGAGMVDLGVLPGASRSGAGDINGLGQIVGHVYAPGNASSEAALWPSTSGPIVQLGGLGGNQSFASSINDAGTIVGSAKTPLGILHPFRIVPVGGLHFLDADMDGVNDLMEDLGQLRPQDIVASATDVNASGQVVGYSSTTNQPDSSGGRAFLFEGAGLIDLNDLVLPTGFVLTAAWAINDAGQIVGSGYVGGEEHAFLLDPLPFPLRVPAPPGPVPMK